MSKVQTIHVKAKGDRPTDQKTKYQAEYKELHLQMFSPDMSIGWAGGGFPGCY